MSITSEVAEAEIVMTNKLLRRHTGRTYTDVLVSTAKQLQRLQSRRQKLQKELRSVDQNIRHTKRELKALAKAMSRGEA